MMAAASSALTHADRVIDTESGITKGELADYYRQSAALLLPHLRERPVALVRAPEGVGGVLFFQKHADANALPEVERLAPGLDPGHEPLLSIRSPGGLRSAAQMNVVELHTWNSTVRSIQKPDRIVFDLDPGEGVAWPTVQEGAILLQSFLAELSLKSFLKTSGGKGLHVVVPLMPSRSWQFVKQFAHAVVLHMARVASGRFVARSGPKNRIGKIFIDYLRNGFGSTTAAAWSARARPGMGVSVPVGWAELDSLQGGAHWTLRSVAARFATGNAPWAGYSASRQGLAAAVKILGFDPAMAADHDTKETAA